MVGQLEGTMAKAGAKVELRAVTAQSTAPEGESTVESSRSLFAEVLCLTVTRVTVTVTRLRRIYCAAACNISP